MQYNMMKMSGDDRNIHMYLEIPIDGSVLSLRIYSLAYAESKTVARSDPLPWSK